MLCEMFATLRLEGGGTSEEQPIRLNSVIPEDFETLVHYYNDFQSVILLQSLPLPQLTRRVGHKGFPQVSPRFSIGKG